MQGPFLAFCATLFLSWLLVSWKLALGLLVAFIALVLVFFPVDAMVACFYSLWPVRDGYSSYCKLLSNQRVLITGANRGIGRALAREMVKHGAIVTVACRSELEITVKDLNQLAKEQNGGKQPSIPVRGFKVDLSDVKSIKDLVNNPDLLDDGHHFDLLCLNAGFTTSNASQTSKDNGQIDLMLMVNYFANFLLTRETSLGRFFGDEFITCLKSQSNNNNNNLRRRPRIVFTSSDSHRWQPYSPVKKVYDYGLLTQVNHYAYTKLCSQMLANELSERYENVIDVYGLCPGPVASDIWRSAPIMIQWLIRFIFAIIFQSCERGAQHICYVCCKPEELMPSGTYHWMAHLVDRSQSSMEKENISDLIQTSEQWLSELDF